MAEGEPPSQRGGGASLAVVVPTRNSGRTIRACLESIREQTAPSALVVVDNWSTDGTFEVASELADVVLRGGPERSAQRNLGAAATSAELLGFVDSDMILPPSVLKEAVDALDAGAARVVIPEVTIGSGYWTHVRAFERSLYQGSDAIEAPRFFTRAVFEAAGGFDEDMTGPEDWDLGIRTSAAGPLSRTTTAIRHDEGRSGYVGLCRKKAYYAPGVARFVRKHGARQAGAQLSDRPWVRKPWLLARPLGIGLVALKAGEAIAVGAALAKPLLTRRRGRPAGRP